jgi:hypothetical protein
VRQTAGLRWSEQLLAVLIDELYVDEDFVALLGEPEMLPVRRYPQALAVALALRHSWRPDDFARLVKRLGVSKSLRHGAASPRLRQQA